MGLWGCLLALSLQIEVSLERASLDPALTQQVRPDQAGRLEPLLLAALGPRQPWVGLPFRRSLPPAWPGPRPGRGPKGPCKVLPNRSP